MSVPYRAHIIKYDTLQNEIVSDCYISSGTEPLVDDETLSLPHGMEHFQAIWDTGATNSGISPKVVRECGLLPTGRVFITHVDGHFEARTFLVNIGLPSGILVNGVTVSESRLSDEADVLIGMDIISMGDFVITNIDKRTAFLFQFPSNINIDRVLDDPDG